ncbi:MAG: hypothetical protein ACI9JN_001215 [Bacteroidia bacterium]|jgi:hypothetical protein
MKLILKITGIFFLVIALFMGSFIMLSKHIFNRRDCIRFNIDNIEVRTGINVPAVVSSDCNCTETSKSSTFKLKTSTLDLETYIEANNFASVDNKLVNSGKNERTKWPAELDTSTANLSFQIEYLQ